MFLSIMGMYKYDQTIFDGLELPTYTDENENIHTINREAVINSILLNCAELELLYPEFDTMKLAIGVWSASEQDTWLKMFRSQKVEYNPIWNVDADIDQSHYGSDENVNSVQGFNSSSWANAKKDKRDYTEKYVERRTGNIGVTATQDLIQKDRDIADFSIIRFITESFKKRFCLMVY